MVFVIRRVHVEKLQVGPIALNLAEAHHVRNVLRLSKATQLELFDDAGAIATGPIIQLDHDNVVIQIDSIITAVDAAVHLTVAAAVPKGDRADWMVEKLTELGVAKFIPMIAERSVVIPAGQNKLARWERIAIESAKQSRRHGVMTITQPMLLKDLITTQQTGWFLSTAADAEPIHRAIRHQPMTVLIGPEGGWTPIEINEMQHAGFLAVGLTATVLRVETAAIITAGILMTMATATKATRSPSSSD